jgi:UDPglucose 6-dehydrogenase
MAINDDRRPMVVNRLKEMLSGLEGKTVGLLGLAFKPNTDDMREAPSLDIARYLILQGVVVKAYDPVAMDAGHELMPEIIMQPDPYTLAEGCDALVVITEWNEFKQLDLERVRRLMNQPVLLDGRNIYDPKVMAALGFTYRGIGRGHNA